MPDRSQKINDYTETSTSDPQRLRPTDRQMGLGSHDTIGSKSNNKGNNKGNK